MGRFLLKSAIGVGLFCVLWALGVPSAEAIPSFARKYKTSCTTCHYAFPKLSAFGKAFKNNGYRYPAGQDLDMTKEEPVSLGAEGNKKMWPDALWPADIAGTSPFSAHLVGRVHYGGEFDDPTTTGTVEKDKALYFELPHEFEVLYGGTIGDNISYFGELELEHAAEVAYGFIAQYDYRPGFHVKLGSVGLAPSPEAHLITREHYNVDELRNQSGTWRMRDGGGGGLELWGAGNGGSGAGGFTYAAGIVNGQTDADNFDLNPAKDVYLRGTYKMGGLGEIGGAEGDGSSASGFYLDNSVRFGAFLYSGKAVRDTLEDKFTVVGGDIDWWMNRFLVTAVAEQMTSDFAGYDRTSLAWVAEVNYVVYPWLITHARYEFTDRDTDKDTPDPATSLIPAVVAMLRPNVKCSLEYLIPLDDPRKDTDRMTFQFNVGL